MKSRISPRRRCLPELSRTSSTVSTERLHRRPTFAQHMIWTALAICLLNTSQSPCCPPNRAEGASPRLLQSKLLMQDKHTVSRCKLSHQNTRMDESVQILLQKTAGSSDNAGNVLSAHPLIPLMCWSAHLQALEVCYA